MIRMTLDCDPGLGVPGANIDDALALAVAATAPGLQLDLVTTVSGNTAANVGAAVAERLLAAWGRDVPVIAGQDSPLGAPNRDVSARTDRSDHPLAEQYWAGLDALRPQEVPPPTVDAADALAAAVGSHPGEIVVVATAPLTNLARAFRRHSRLPEQISRLVLMGGALDVPGYRVETNLGLDPLAAREVLAAPVPITVVPMDATIQTMLTAEQLHAMAVSGGPVARSLVPGVDPWVRFSAATRGLPGCWLHDAVAVGLLVDPELVATRRARVSVTNDGALVAGSGAAVDVVTRVDNTRLHALLAAAFHTPIRTSA
ncbi:nucleoside hydrolase [Flexivirga meconopsidis]|uniref:nucleoside hydrolase n=1 Tax=Flexivirga meconopsidis TaxID=2977121 RepID=UPI00223F58E2|nr:nucleoside hydrolase [Flexivirga meconopsidis]